MKRREALAIAIDALQYIELVSQGCPVVLDGKDVPKKWQKFIRKEKRNLRDEAHQALKTIEEFL